MALIYVVLILFNTRLHTYNNVFTVNVCVASLCSSIFWLLHYIFVEFYPSVFDNYAFWLSFSYFETMYTFQIPLALVQTSTHRLFTIVYRHKTFFRGKTYITLCIVCQWMIGVVLLLPVVFHFRFVSESQTDYHRSIDKTSDLSLLSRTNGCSVGD